jgi:plastocyanin
MEINSGVLCKTPLCPGSQYYYKIQVDSVPAAGLTVHFVCLIHGPVMSGSLTILSSESEDVASSQSDLDSAAAAQYAPQSAQGTAAKNAALAQAAAAHKVLLGAESADGRVQVLEMLPNSFSASKGQKVTFATIAQNEIHTATFPKGHGSDSVDPFTAVCEAGPPDAAFVPPTSGPPCGDPSKFEVHFNPQPQGETNIKTTTTIGSSGVLALFGPYASSFDFHFPNAGTFAYQCRIHDHMTGTIVVASPAAAQPVRLATTGGGREPGSSPVPFGLLLGGLAGLLGLGILGARRLGSIRR